MGELIHTEPEQVLDKPDMTHMYDGTLKPAFSFAQIAQVGDQRFLFASQCSDTMLLIKKSDRTFDTSLAVRRPDFGLGDMIGKSQRRIPTTRTPINAGDVVYGFSDGIGEFLTMEECQVIILKNEDPSLLLSELKAKIIEKGDGVSGNQSVRGANGANGRSLKFHNWDNRGLHDDISMFSLSVN